MNSPIDVIQRQRAIDPFGSFAVSAPAGSGKTGLLTLRVLKLLSQCEKPEEILCITFTRKAANEMKERIVGAIHDARALTTEDIKNTSDEHQKTLLTYARAAFDNSELKQWNILESSHRLRILTIDGFCASLVQSMPLVSTLGGRAKVVDDPTNTYELAVHSLLDDLSNQGWPSSLKHLYTHLNCDIDRVSKLLISILGNRDQWLPLLYQLQTSDSDEDNDTHLRQQLEKNLVCWADDIVSELCALLAVFEGEICEHVDFAGSNIEKTAPDSTLIKLAGIFEFPNQSNSQQAIESFWKPFSELVLTKDYSFRKTLNKNNGFPPGTKETKQYFSDKKQRFLEILGELKTIPGLRDNLELISIFPKLSYDDNQWLILKALCDLLPLLVAHLKITFQQQAHVDFIEVSERAKTALGSFDDISELALRLDYTLKHILVDEFQDTSHSQRQLLNLLLREWHQDEDKTIFVVGDGMQSCYGFRNANVGIFLDVREQGIGDKPLEKIDLSVNFRSTANIIDWINTHFKTAFPEQDDISRGAVAYSTSESFQQNDASDNSYVYCNGYLEDNDSTTEATHIAQQIQACRTEFPEDSIAILVRSRTHLEAIIPALQQRGIAYTAVDIDPLHSRQWVQDVHALTSVIENPEDAAAWLTLLRAPWCALDNFDLNILFTQLDKTEKTCSLSYKLKWARDNKSLSQVGNQQLAQLVAPVFAAQSMRERRPTRELVESIWIQLQGPLLLERDAQRQDIDVYFDLLSNHCGAGGLIDRVRFNRAFLKLFAQPDVQPNAVHIMTMHKSKGLEFDTVFLPCLHKLSRPDAPSLLYWHERLNAAGENNLLLSPISSSTDAEADPLSKLLRHEAKRRNEYEETRLFYVACTRAKSRLYLSGSLKKGKDESPVAPSKSSLLSRIWSTAGEQFALIEQVELAEQAQEHLAQAPNPRTRVRTGIQRLNAINSPAVVNSIEAKFDNQQWALPEFDNTDETLDLCSTQQLHNKRSRALGTVLHRILKALHDHGDLAINTEQLSPFWLAQLQQEGLSHTQAWDGLAELSDHVSSMLQSETGQWLLNNKHSDSHCELRISYGKPASLAVVDRTFIDSDGCRWIVDYKSSKPAGNEDKRDFVEREMNEYRKQLEFYRELIADLDAQRPELNVKDCRCALFFPAIDHLAELRD